MSQSTAKPDFWQRFAIEPASGRAVLAAAAADQPWYLMIFTALGAWLAAALLFGALELAFWSILAELAPAVEVAIGISIAAAGTYLYRRWSAVFPRQFFLASVLVGHFLIAVAVSAKVQAPWAAFAICGLLASATIAAIDSTIFQTAVTVLVLGLLTFAIGDWNMPYIVDIASLIILPVAAAAWLWPPRARDLRPAASLALLWLCIYPDLILSFHATQQVFADGWIARTVHILAIGLVLWRSRDELPGRHLIPHFAALVVAALLLPPQGSAILFLLAFAYFVGNLPLALLGLVAEGHFLISYYYFLPVDLLTKSGILIAVGTVLAAGYGLMRRRRLR